MKRIIGLMDNGRVESKNVAKEVADALERLGFGIVQDNRSETEVNISIGGDGAFLKNVHDLKFPETPFVGVNTGHLGFFQEVSVEGVAGFARSLADRDYSIEEIDIVEVVVRTSRGEHKLKAVNEVAVKGVAAKVVHLDVYIDDEMLENISGDGVIVATPMGSTAYNFSCGGSIVSPKVPSLQLTPIAPISSKAYRSLNNSLILPTSSTIVMKPIERDKSSVVVIVDGYQYKYNEVESMLFKLSDYKLKKLCVKQASFWNNVREKFL